MLYFFSQKRVGQKQLYSCEYVNHSLFLRRHLFIIVLCCIQTTVNFCPIPFIPCNTY